MLTLSILRDARVTDADSNAFDGAKVLQLLYRAEDEETRHL
jgi:hypothetical protein